MEVLGFPFKNAKEEAFVREILSLFEIVYIDENISEVTIKIRRQGRIKLPDAIISATAISRKLTLVTRNVDDFKNIDVSITNPFA